MILSLDEKGVEISFAESAFLYTQAQKSRIHVPVSIHASNIFGIPESLPSLFSSSSMNQNLLSSTV
jgi:hypothetical protein